MSTQHAARAAAGPPASRPGWRPVLALLRETLWLRAALAVVAFSVACVFLGRWQLHRYEAKAARADRIDANYDAAPVPLGAVLATPEAALPLRDEWRPVEVTGRYEPDGTLLVRNRPRDGDFGYEVLVPLRLADGSALLVDRGWIPFGQTAGTAARVPEPPAGQVRVQVRLRPPEPDRPGTDKGRTVSRIAVPQLEPLVGGPLHRAYGLLARETPTVPDRPAAAERPDTDLGVNLPYAIQWWGFGIAGYVLLLVYARREVQRRMAEGEPVAREPSTPRRAGVRDEDVEDAQIDRALRTPSSAPPGPAAPPRSER